MNIRRSWIFPVLVLVIVASCKKEPEEIGLNLVQGEELGLEYDTTINIAGRSEMVDSVKTDELTTQLLGSLYDPVFGITTASIYTQLALSINDPDFGDSPQLDSVVLSLQYTGYYGDTITEQNFRVYELTEPVIMDSNYYSDQALEYNNLEIASQTIAPKPTDSVTIDTNTYTAHLRIPLSEEFGNKLLSLPESVLDNTEAFQNEILGLYVTADPAASPGNGALLYFSLTGAMSKVTVYFDQGDEYDFDINENCARFVNYDHNDYFEASSQLKAQLFDENPATDKAYLQSTGGIRTRITFPDIENWRQNGSYAINEAILVLSVDNPDEVYEVPTKLVLTQINEDGTTSFFPDQFEGEDFIGGTYNEERGEYRFRIPRYFQEIISEPASGNSFYVSISGASVNAYRAVIQGAGANSGRIRLNLIYTNVN